MILVLQTNTFGAHGGIPTYNRMVCDALGESDERLAGTDVRVLIANDTRADVASNAGDVPRARGHPTNHAAVARWGR